ncbi:MAG: cytidine deaminase [Actinomycetota bacterium]|nr:cytidine deaminase [Actinomycetota bacterium]
MSDLSDEDAKLVALAKQARARIQAKEGAAVRDDTGRSYSGATVELPSTSLTALQLAVAQAVAAGARDIEAAVVVTNSTAADHQPITEASSSPTPLHICSPMGDVVASTIVES